MRFVGILFICAIVGFIYSLVVLGENGVVVSEMVVRAFDVISTVCRTTLRNCFDSLFV